MPHFRCTACQSKLYSPVVIGAGDCPNCGGDVVFDVHRRAEQRAPEQPRPGLLERLRRLARRRS